MGLTDKIVPYLDGFRELVFKGSEMIARALELNANNVYAISILVIAILLSKWILEFFYTTLEGRKLYWLILTGVFYFILKVFGI